MTNLLNIQNLSITAKGKKILHDFALKLSECETHFMLGPNGSGKSSLAKMIAGHPAYKHENGTICFKTNNLLKLSPELRAQAGIFIAFQNPVEISGVNTFDFLFSAFNNSQRLKRLPEVTSSSFFKLLKFYSDQLHFKTNFFYRDFNEGFSGGEKKKIEILQVLLLKPKLLILDEFDSGLDVDALKLICGLLNKIKKRDKATLLIITHNTSLFKIFLPKKIHVIINGKLKYTGGRSLLNKIERQGFYLLDKKAPR